MAVKLGLFQITSAGFALILIVLGVPLTGDAVMRLFTDSSVDLYKLQNSTPQDLAANEAMLKNIDRRFGDPAARIRAGIMERRLAYDPNGEPDPNKLDIASADLEAGLARAPANDLAWAELAQARLDSDDHDAAKAAWRTSILLGNFDPPLSLFRTELGWRLWLNLDAEERQMLYDQMTFAWDGEPRQIAAIAKQNPFILAVFRVAFAQDQDRLAALNEAVRGAP